MDSLNLDARSPPPFVKDRIHFAIDEFKRLSNKLAQKTKAIAKLENDMPKSLRQKLTLNTSKLLSDANPTQAQALSTQFDKILNDRQNSLRKVILASAQAERDVIQSALDQLVPTVTTELKTYFAKIFATMFPEPTHPFEAMIGETHNITAVPTCVSDCRLAISFLEQAIESIRYRMILDNEYKLIKQAEAAAKRGAAMDMEVNTPNDELVAALVKREIAKATSSLRNEIKQLKGTAGRIGQATGSTPKAKNQNAGGKAPGQRNDAKTKKNVKKSETTLDAGKSKKANKSKKAKQQKA
jgi:hypothetical protein